MTQTAAPKVPWLLPFQRKDLLTAAWGSKKGADLLYHFLHRASWEKENKHKNETLKDIKFQESTPKALEKSGLSLGSFHTYLKLFVSVGYLSSEAYSSEYTLHIEVIQQAFSQAPEKPGNETRKRSYTPRDSFNLKDCNFVTLPREDYEMLMELKDECFKLKEMFQSLKHDHAQMLEEMKQIFQSLKQNPTIHTAPEAEAEAISDPKSNDLRDSLEDDLEREREEDTGNVADRELPTPAPSQDEPYRPDFSASQRKPYKSDGNDGHSCNPPQGEIHESNGHSDIPARDDHRGNHRSDGQHQQVLAGHTSGTTPTQRQSGLGAPPSHPTQHAADSGRDPRASMAGAGLDDAQEAELSTLQGSSPQASAKVEPRPMSRAAHIDFAFQWLDAVRRRASGDPLASYVANGANKKRVADLIDACRGTANEVNEINIALAWMALWNGGQWSNGKSWQDPGMLTVKAFCEHYGESLDRARAKPQRKKPAADTPVNFTQLRLAAEAKARAQQGVPHG